MVIGSLSITSNVIGNWQLLIAPSLLSIIIVKVVAVPTVRPVHKSVLICYLRILANVTQTASNNLARNGHCLFEIAL